MATELKTHPQYNSTEVERFFVGRGWKVEFVRVGNEDLVPAEEGAAVECIDGRFGKRKEIKKHGPKLPGASLAIAASKTGGNTIGFNAAASEIARLGYRAGTHVHCGFLHLWQNGELVAVKHKLELPNIPDQANWMVLKQKQWGGKHFHISDEHEEEALTFNPFLGLTNKARKDRFGYDHWLMQILGIHRRSAMHLVAETVERISSHRKVEILTK